MTRVYLDTSILVAALVDEPLGSSARRALAVDRGERPLVSDWTVSEFASAMGLKVRRQDMPEHKAVDAIAFLDTLVSMDLDLIAVERPHFRTATSFCRHFQLGLRTPDALHLAIGSACGAMVLTLDERMWRAGRSLGLNVSLVA